MSLHPATILCQLLLKLDFIICYYICNVIISVCFDLPFKRFHDTNRNLFYKSISLDLRSGDFNFLEKMLQ